MAWSCFISVKKALDKEDVEGLLSLGCPSDEYDGEAALIENGIAKQSDFGKRILSKSQVVKLIADVWSFKFGPFSERDLQRRRPAFERVAGEIQSEVSCVKL